ncbi:MAG: Gfo/Idh/MocA family oxidoreductase [Clostridia bacterium]|nr:Gfo/Idh/MocA family oxidoreductase [Clostridia bacterium]
MVQKVTENNKSPLTFALLGCGMAANIHADAIQEIEGATLKGVFDPNVISRESFSKKYNITIYSSFEELLNDANIDVVCVCTPSFLHAEHTIAALKSGKHVVVEKPMAMSSADADKIIKASQDTGKLVTVISQIRFSPDVQKIKDLLKENAFGTVSLCSLSMNYYRTPEYYSSSNWRGSMTLDGGVLMNQGIHGIDLIEYIMGPVKEVKGKTGTIVHNIEAPDTAVAVIEFECGVLGIIEASTCAYPGFSRRIKIQGDKGYVVLKENNIEKLMINGEKIIDKVQSEQIVKTAKDPTKILCGLHRLQIENFVRAINAKEPLLVDGVEGRKALTVIEKIYNIT